MKFLFVSPLSLTGSSFSHTEVGEIVLQTGYETWLLVCSHMISDKTSNCELEIKTPTSWDSVNIRLGRVSEWEIILLLVAQVIIIINNSSFEYVMYRVLCQMLLDNTVESYKIKYLRLHSLYIIQGHTLQVKR